MSERINKLILETEFRTTGDVSQSTSKIQQLQETVKKTEGDTLKLVEAENKLRNAALEAGKAVETQTTKQSDFQRQVSATGKAMNDIATNNKLEKAFAGGGKKIEDVSASLRKFEASARSAKSVDELTASVNEFVDALPNDVRNEAVEMLDKEFDKVGKTIERPTARLRELKRLIATTDDPVLLRRYNEEAGELTDRLGDNNDLIRALASDTFFTDSLVEGAQVAVAGFTAFQGALSLVTDDQEELARAAQKAQGALALLQGTQTLLNELKKSDNIITRAQIAAQKIYTVAVGESVGAQKAFRIALLATGIGALILGIGLLAANWSNWTKEVKKSTFEKDINNRVTKRSNELYTEEAVKIEIARQKLANENLPRKERTALVKELQKEYPTYLKNIDAEKATYEELTKALDEVSAALLIKFKIQAAEEEVVRLSKSKIDAERAYQTSLTNTTKALEDINNLEDVNTETLNAIRNLSSQSTSAVSSVLQKDIARIDEQIKKLIDQIITDSQRVNFGESTVKKSTAALEGSIEFYQERVNKIQERLTKGLVANSEEFNNLLPLFRIAQKQLDDARKSLGQPNDAQIFTAGSLNALRAQASELDKIINNLPEGRQLQERVKELGRVQKDIEALQNIINPNQQENTRKQLREEERRFQLEILDITEATEKEKLALQIRYAKERLNELLKEKADEVEIQKAENLIDALELKFEQLGKRQALTTEQLIDGFSQVINAAASAANQFIQIKQEENQRLIDVQQQRVSDAEAIADRGNAQILDLERKRLRDLNEANERFAQRQIEIATAQLIAESALAIAKAASQGGALAPFTIAATLIALGAGLASARAQAQAVGAAASFRKGGIYDGGYTGDGEPNKVSTRLGIRPYEYHLGEHIMPAEVVGIGQNRKILEDIRIKRIDLQQYLGGNKPTVIVNNDSKDVVKAIERIPGVSINLNRNGIISIVESRNKTEQKRQSIKRR